MKRPRAAALAACVFLATAGTAAAQTTEAPSFWDPTVRFSATALIPALGDEQVFDLGGRGLASLETPLFLGFAPSVYAGASLARLRGIDPLVLTEGGVGLSWIADPIPRIRLRAGLQGGVWNTERDDTAYAGFRYGALAEAGIRLSPALTLSLSGAFDRFQGAEQPLLTAFGAGLSLAFELDNFANDRTRIRVDSVETGSVFPVFYSYYDRNSFGTIAFTNLEETEITDVKVSFFLPRFMGRPKPCETFAVVRKGASAKASLNAIFDDRVLELTEGVDAEAEVIVEYRLLGAKRVHTEAIKLRMHHRNAMTWQDDRRAAAFISPKDPAVLWLARYSGAVTRDRSRPDINRNLQIAMGAFEVLKLYGVNYVVDPASSYAEKSGDEGTVDYLQYPYQTLSYRGGDCDDLSITFCSIMEASGVKTALITVPGHIYMAFSLGVTEAEAAATFADRKSYVMKDGVAWAPVEITMVKDGFVKAWRVGAKEWYDNAAKGAAAFYPVEEAWKLYPSVGIPNVKARFDLPPETEAVLAFDSALNRHVAREIEPELRKARAESLGKSAPEVDNRLGIVYARFGLLKDAWDRFSAASKANYQPAWTNLGNVAFLRKDYELALDYYRWAAKLDPSDQTAWLGVARCEFELERFDAVDAAYARLAALDPELASGYGYLASVYGGEGRAWSFSDRLARTAWAPQPKPAPVVAKAEPAPAPEPAAPEPAKQEPAPVQPAPAATPEVARVEPEAKPEAAPAAAPEPVAPEPVQPQPAPEPVPQPSAPAAKSAPALPPEPKEAPKVAELPEDRDLPPAEAAKPAPALPPEPKEAPKVAELPEDRDLPPVEAAKPAPALPPEPKEAPKVAELPEDRDLPPVEAAKPAPEPVAPAQTEPVAPPPAQTPAAKPAAETVQPKAAAAPEQAPAAKPAATSPEQAPSAKPAAAPQRDDPWAPKNAAPAVEKPAAPPETKPAAAPSRVTRHTPDDFEPRPSAAPKATPAIERPAEKPTVAETAPSAPQAEPERVPEPETPPPTVELPAIEPPAAAVEAPVGRYETLVRDFKLARALVGSWTISGTKAEQTDPAQYFAKLGVGATQGSKPLRYRFAAKSNGTGWVGVGLHVYVRASFTDAGYGQGESLLVWLTRDPYHNADSKTRLQLYRSTSDVDMELVSSVVVPESAFDRNAVTIDLDPVKGTLSVAVNGTPRLAADSLGPMEGGLVAVFRSIDRAEFGDFSIEELR